ncbi:MAG TPA: hypothetical protein VJ761_25790 [Ktedonobacteraceae bacterium]|nr:hypothetical protein [Ktedonobacteraceae bacterium]
MDAAVGTAPGACPRWGTRTGNPDQDRHQVLSLQPRPTGRAMS